MELEEMRSAVVGLLTKAGITAITAFEQGNRLERDCPVVSVSLRGCGVKPLGLADYLGERWNKETREWEEIYGRRATLTLGLDIYASVEVGAQAMDATFDQVVEALSDKTSEGLYLETISCGETKYAEEHRLLMRPVEAECQLYLYAVQAEGGQFLDFRVKGGFIT